MTQDEQMAGLRARFLERLEEDRARLEAAIAAGDEAVIRALVHRISGAAGMFGYAALSDRAAEVEEALDEGADVEALVDRLLAEIRAA